MNEPDYCSRFSHPAWGVVDIAELPGPIPLNESQHPLWFTSLDAEAQDQLTDSWWRDLMVWLSREGATWIMVQLAPWDFETASRGGYTRINKWEWQAEWSPGMADVLYRMNPELAVVNSGSRQLLAMLDGLEGVTTEQELRDPFFADGRS